MLQRRQRKNIKAVQPPKTAWIAFIGGSRIMRNRKLGCAFHTKLRAHEAEQPEKTACSIDLTHSALASSGGLQLHCGRDGKAWTGLALECPNTRRLHATAVLAGLDGMRLYISRAAGKRTAPCAVRIVRDRQIRLHPAGLLRAASQRCCHRHAARRSTCHAAGTRQACRESLWPLTEGAASCFDAVGLG